MITKIEEISLNAWPALRSMLVDGWLLRFSGGYTRRANSINPLYPSENPVEETIRFCQTEYRNQGLPVVFKMTSASHPDNLDTILEQGGYQYEAPTLVQLLDLHDKSYPQPAFVHLSSQPDTNWLDAFSRMSGIVSGRRVLHDQILAAIVPECCFASVRLAGEVAACGLGVVQDGYIGLYDIITDLRFRQRGYGNSLVCSLLGWGVSRNARWAYLQVMKENLVAQRLYRRIGFKEIYQYWYRVLK